MADVASIPDWLAQDQPWLAAQPHMAPWPDGAGRILTQLAAWGTQYATELGFKPVDTCSAPLWSCWSHHWRTAIDTAGLPVDGWAVAAEIQSGRGRRGGGQLGGNVLRDLVLAHAMLQKDDAAIRRFEADYQDTITRQVSRVHHRARDDDGWWNDLLAELVGVSREGRPGRLARYHGRSGLVIWAVTVAVRLLHDRSGTARRVGELEADPPGSGGSNAEPVLGLLSADCKKLLVARVRTALEMLSREHRLMLRMAFADGSSGQQIARVIGIHPGNVTRRRQDAVRELQSRLAGTASDEVRDCLSVLLTSGQAQDLGEAMMEALQNAAREGNP
jgi:RNA polymerase sigma factor (sigma-70 family)